MNKYKILIAIVALVILILIVIYPPRRTSEQTIIRQEQEIRTKDKVDQNEAVEAIEKNLLQ